MSRVTTQRHGWELNPQLSSYKAELFSLSHGAPRKALRKRSDGEEMNTIVNKLGQSDWLKILLLPDELYKVITTMVVRPLDDPT